MKIGDYLVEICGYEQTNVTFYKVVDIKSKTAIVQRVNNKINERLTDMSARIIPNDEFIDEPFKKRIMTCKYNNQEYCKMTYGRAYIWDGHPQFCSWWG